MPAYRAAQTLKACFEEIPPGCADLVILVDDASTDDTVSVARQLPIKVVRHTRNLGYGGNQKTCYTEALAEGADIVVMLHPDGQYDARVIPAMVEVLRRGECEWVIASRLLTPGGALGGGMPLYKFWANRLLTKVENWLAGMGLSECHSGYRAYTRKFLETVPFRENSDDFVFDTQVLLQGHCFGFVPRELAVETRYFEGCSSIGMRDSAVYALKTLYWAGRCWLHKRGWLRCRIFG